MNAEGTVAEVLAGAAKWSTLVGDVRETLRTVPDGSAQTCVTSPPYYGLRSYDGGAAEIGQEQSPAEYVAAMVAVMREVRRVVESRTLGAEELAGHRAAEGCYLRRWVAVAVRVEGT